MKRKIVNIIMMAMVLCVSPMVTSGQVDVYAAEGEYILPDSDSRAYTYEELSGLSAQEIMDGSLSRQICRIISIPKAGTMVP